MARLGVSSQVERQLCPGMVAMGILHTMVCTYSESVCSGACAAGDVKRTAQSYKRPIYRLNKWLFSGSR